jgi:hypothetical protein
MKKKNNQGNGQSHLEEAMALLIQNQAAFLGRVAEMDRVSSDRFARIDERFARLESNMTAVLRVLAEHGRLLEALPEAVRDKIGFKSGPQSAQ